MDLRDEKRIASAVFFPRPDAPWGPEAEEAFDHLFDTEDGVRLRLRIFPGDKRAPVILFFHGNGETARDYDMMADPVRALPATFVVAEYRGYGPCTGTPTVHDLLPDAHRSLDEARRVLAGEGHGGPWVAMGRSLGSAPALELASTRSGDLAALILESGFARIVPLLELVGVPARELGITEEYGPRNREKMESVSLPTLILHAEWDQIIPIEDAELLHDACRDPGKEFVRIPGAGHNDIQLKAGRAYFEHMGRLLGRIAS